MFRKWVTISLALTLLVGCSTSEPEGSLSDETSTIANDQSAESSQSADETEVAAESTGTTNRPMPNEEMAAKPSDDVLELTSIEWARMYEERDYDLSHLNGQRIRLSGIVGDVDMDFYKNIPTIKFRTADGFWYGVMCYIPGPPLWETIKPGQKLTLEYTHSSDSSIYPNDCKVLSVEGAPAAAIDAQSFVDAYTADMAAADEAYRFDSKSRRLGLSGTVRKVIQPDVGPLLIIFETESPFPVVAEMSSDLVGVTELPSAGEKYQAWGSYSSYVEPEADTPPNEYLNSVGIAGAVPFPVDSE